MPKLRQSGVTGTGRVLTFEGTARHAVTSIAQILSVTGGREIDLLIGTAPAPPVLNFTVQILGLNAQIAQNGSDTDLSANLFANGELVEAYVAANWNWTIDDDGSGGASFTGDDLTVGPNVGQVVIRATYDNNLDPANPANGTTQTATTNVVAAPLTFTVVLTGLPASAVQDNTYTLGAERRDGTGQVIDSDPANFTFTIITGGTFGSIINGNQLQVNAGTAGNSITVRASHNVGGEVGDGTTNIIVQPTFSNNEPAGFTPILIADGTTKDFSTGQPVAFTLLSQGTRWLDDNAVAVVVDPASKNGSAIEKRWFVGDPTGWNGVVTGRIGEWRELYFRFIFMLSDNWQYINSNSKVIFYDKAPEPHFVLWGENRVGFNDFGSGVGEYDILTDPLDPKSTVRPSPGVYHTLEYHHVASVNPGEGSLRVWLDGVEFTQFVRRGHFDEDGGAVTLTGKTWLTTEADADKRIGGNIEFPWFWGGDGEIKDRNDFVRFSEMYISGRN